MADLGDAVHAAHPWGEPGSFTLYPTVHYLYPNLAAAKRIEASEVEEVRRTMGPNDRLFIFRPE